MKKYLSAMDGYGNYACLEVVFESNKKVGDEKIYLALDCEGNMQIANTPNRNVGESTDHDDYDNYCTVCTIGGGSKLDLAEALRELADWLESQ